MLGANFAHFIARWYLPLSITFDLPDQPGCGLVLLLSVPLQLEDEVLGEGVRNDDIQLTVVDHDLKGKPNGFENRFELVMS